MGKLEVLRTYKHLRALLRVWTLRPVLHETGSHGARPWRRFLRSPETVRTPVHYYEPTIYNKETDSAQNHRRVEPPSLCNPAAGARRADGLLSSHDGTHRGTRHHGTDREGQVLKGRRHGKEELWIQRRLGLSRVSTQPRNADALPGSHGREGRVACPNVPIYLHSCILNAICKDLYIL